MGMSLVCMMYSLADVGDARDTWKEDTVEDCIEGRE